MELQKSNYQEGKFRKFIPRKQTYSGGMPDPFGTDNANNNTIHLKVSYV